MGSWGFHHSFELYGGLGALGSRSLFGGFWARCLLVVRDVPEFANVEGVPSAFVLGIHCVFCVATSGVDGETQSSVKILPRLLRSGSTGNVGLGLRSECSYPHFWRTHTSGIFTRLPWARCSRGIRHVRRSLFASLLTRLVWARCSRGIRHAPHGLFAALLTHLVWARCSRGILHARRGLFAAFLTGLAWARCSGEGSSQCQSRG